MCFELTPAQIISELFILTHYERRKSPAGPGDCRLLHLISLVHSLTYAQQPSPKPGDKLALRAHTLTYGSCALRRWPSPQHGMKGTGVGRRGQPSHRLPCQAAASAQPRSMSALFAHLCANHQKMKDSRDGRESGCERCQESRCDLETQSVHRVIFGYPRLFLIFDQSSDCCSQVHSSAHHSPHPKSLSTLTDPLSCQIICSGAATVTVVDWHAGPGLGASGHTLHHKQVLSQQVKEVELWSAL